MSGQKIAVIKGDGIGPEVIDSARAVLDAVCEKRGIELSYTEFDWSCQRYEHEGTMMPDDGIDTLRRVAATISMAGSALTVRRPEPCPKSEGGSPHHQHPRIARITLAYRHLTVSDGAGMRLPSAHVGGMGIMSSEHAPRNPSVVAIRGS